MMGRTVRMVCLLLGFTVACGRGTGPAATPTPLIPLPLPLPTNTIAPATSLPATATPPPTPSLTTPPPGAPLGQHTVREGETLSCIGRAYAVPPSAIAQASNLSASEVLPVGTVLQIPAVRWEDVPPGPVCVPQFQSPFVSTPLITPTPAVAGLEKILIVEPGSGSSVTSPVRVTGQADPTFEQSLVVQVFNENGEAIATVPVQIAADISQRGPFAVDVPFSVSASQPGRVVVYSASARDGGLIHLASAEVTLLPAGGVTSLTSGRPYTETITILTPISLEVLRGGTARITGFSDYVFESQLGVAICGEGGSGELDLICGTKDNLLGTGVAMVASPDVGQPGPFTADVRYTVAAPQHGRVVVYDTSPRDGGIIHLSTQEVRLEP